MRNSIKSFKLIYTDKGERNIFLICVSNDIVKESCLVVDGSSFNRCSLVLVYNKRQNFLEPVSERLGQNLVVCVQKCDWSPVFELSAVTFLEQ